MSLFRINVELDELTETGLAAALATVTGNQETPTALMWQHVGPAIEKERVSLAYTAAAELRVRKRNGEPQDDPDWTATISSGQRMVVECGKTALIAAARAVIARLAPLKSYPFPKKNIQKHITTSYPITRALLNESPLHKVISGSADRNVYMLIPKNGAEAEDVKLELTELVALCRELRPEEWNEPPPNDATEFSVVVRYV